MSKIEVKLIVPLIPFAKGMEDTGSVVEIFFVFPHGDRFSTFQFFKHFRQPFKFEYVAGGKTLHTQFLDYEFGKEFFSLWKLRKATYSGDLKFITKNLLPQKRKDDAILDISNIILLDYDDTNLCYECSENEIKHHNGLCASCYIKLFGNE